MPDEKPHKVSVGFIGSQVLSGRISPSELATLRGHLDRSEGAHETRWHDVRFEEGTVALDLSKVVYVLVEDEEHRVGFGA